MQNDDFVFNYFGDLDAFGSVHFTEYGTHIVAVDLRKIVFCQIFYELHHLNSKAVSLDPHPKLGVFCLDL